MGLHKIIQSGCVVETYEYAKTLSPYIAFKRRGVRNKDIKQVSRRKDNQKRLTQAFKRVVFSNLVGASPYLITFTFRDYQDIKQGYAKIRQFHQKIRYHFGASFRFILVPEFGRKSTKRLHFHALYWGLPFALRNERVSRKLATLWGHGFLDLVVTDSNPKLATYMSKYVFKALSNSLLFQQKAYICSRNILRPVLFINHDYFSSWGDFKQGWDTDIILEYMIGDKLVAQSKQYDTLWLGRCMYKLYQ